MSSLPLSLPAPTSLASLRTFTPSPPQLRLSFPPLASAPRHLPISRATHHRRLDPKDAKVDIMEDEDEEEETKGGGRSPDEPEYDKDPEMADILGSCFDDPQKAQERVEERLLKKKNKVLQEKMGSAKSMQVIFKKFDFNNSYIWFECYRPLLGKDISLLRDTLRAWHIIGSLGGCNSMNMQLSESPLDMKQPVYEVKRADKEHGTFYNIGDLEIQDNLARIWVDIGAAEPLLLDVLINALINISSDYLGIKKVVFGGLEFKGWKENFNVEDAGCSIHKI